MAQTFEVCWKLDGTAKVKADTFEEAIGIAEREFESWTGMGIDVAEVSVDGVEVFD